MLIDARNIRLQKGTNTVLDNVSLEIESGQIIGLIGPNGAGKTSLLKVLAHVEQSYQGDYLLDGKAIHRYAKKALAKRMAYLAQNAQSHWPLSARKVIELGRLPWQGFARKLSAQDQLLIEQAAAKTDVNHLMDRPINSLSGGEQTRVFLARIFAGQPALIFADEPIAALDPYHQLHVMEILQQHAKAGGTVLVVMHDLNLASRFCDKLVLMNHGKILKYDNAQTLIEDPLLAQTYGISLRTFKDDGHLCVIPGARQIKS